MNTSSFRPATPFALRALWGVAAAGLLFERAPWNQSSLLGAADGYLAFLALGLFAVTGGGSGVWRKILIAVFAAWLAVMACRLSGIPA